MPLEVVSVSVGRFGWAACAEVGSMACDDDSVDVVGDGSCTVSLGNFQMDLAQLA